MEITNRERVENSIFGQRVTSSFIYTFSDGKIFEVYPISTQCIEKELQKDITAEKKKLILNSFKNK